MLNDILKQDLLVNGARSTKSFTLLKFYFSKPSFKAIYLYRLYSSLYGKSAFKNFISKLLWLHAVRVTGCYISPKAQIGGGLFLPHPTGIVIGDGVIIGSNVTIYQNVTIGLNGKSDIYPTISDSVIIYAGACVLGNIEIKSNVIVGANAVVLKTIPENSKAVGVPAKVIS